MKPIRIEFIEQEKHRYDTLGDYREEKNHIWFKITELPTPTHSMACLLHELVEKWLNKKAGITDAQVDEWDMAHPELDEPGEHRGCPYHRQHQAADAIERTFMVMAGEDWENYADEVSAALFKEDQSL